MEFRGSKSSSQDSAALKETSPNTHKHALSHQADSQSNLNSSLNYSLIFTHLHVWIHSRNTSISGCEQRQEAIPARKIAFILNQQHLYIQYMSKQHKLGSNGLYLQKQTIIIPLCASCSFIPISAVFVQFVMQISSHHKRLSNIFHVI